MPATLETKKGIAYLKGIFEAGRTLILKEPREINRGNAYLFEVFAFSKGWHTSISRETIDDLPNTTTLQQDALSLARGLDERFKNVDPNLYVTRSGRLLRIDIEWPPLPVMTPQGLAAASGVRVFIEDHVTKEASACSVQMTHMQTMPGGEVNAFNRTMWIVNTVRLGVDDGILRFFANLASLTPEVPTLGLQTNVSAKTTIDPKDYLIKKVWTLAFKAGGGAKQVRAWIADPWDAAYLGISIADFREAAAVLDAQGVIDLSPDELFASVGKSLLAANGPAKLVSSISKPTFRTALGTYTPEKTLGEGGSGRVLLVSDQNGDKYALKYLKPNVQTTQKTKRFRNELSFCTQNSHKNIITVLDQGLAEIEDTEVPFFVMPHLPKTLRSVMGTNASPEQLLILFADVLNGLEHAHESSIWHRDIKPENVLLTDAGDQAIITDFGIAHFDDEYLQTIVDTSPQDRLANFRYAAPEQRSKGIIDQRADIYALGVVLYELFTGDLLQGTNHRRIASINIEFAYLDPIVEGMTCQSPEDRIGTISLIREMLVKNSPTKMSAVIRDRFDRTTDLEDDWRKTKAPLATASYEKIGTLIKVNTFVRPHQQTDGTFTFATTRGEVFNGTEQQVALRFIEADRTLQAEGLSRRNWANLSGKRLFDL